MDLSIPDLPPDTAHVWNLNLDHLYPFDFLSSDERAKAARFHFDKDRQRYTTGRNALRFLLGAYLKQNPATLQFTYGPAGKPSLPQFSFNLAHTGPYALIAITTGGPIGIDIEQVRDLPDMDDVARSVFSPGELQRWRDLPPAEKTPAFYRIWTRKEAYLKALGEGIAHRLQKFEVTFAPDETPRIITGAEGPWTLHDISPSPYLTAALAHRSPTLTIQAFPLATV